MDASFHNEPRKTKIKTSKGKITFLQCPYRRQMVLQNYSNHKSPGTGI